MPNEHGVRIFNWLELRNRIACRVNDREWLAGVDSRQMILQMGLQILSGDFHDSMVPRSSSCVNASTFLRIPSNFARLIALLRKSAEKSAWAKRSRSVRGVARYASRGAKAGWAGAGSPFQGQTSWQMSQPKA
jgi:hypothetical protein